MDMLDVEEKCNLFNFILKLVMFCQGGDKCTCTHAPTHTRKSTRILSLI